MFQTWMMDFTVKTKGLEVIKSVPGLCDYLFSYFQLNCYCFLLNNYVLLYVVDYTSLLICVILTTNLYVMLIFPDPNVINLLARLSLRILLLATLHYCVYQLDDIIRHLCLLDD